MPPNQQPGAPRLDSPEETDRLYGLPLEQFVKERDELARRLRSEGRREDAAQVAKLSKPAVAAWAANQVLRSQPKSSRELRDAGTALADAQRSALRGRAAPGELRNAIERHRAALAAMMKAARGLLDGRGRGLSDATLQRVSRTLAAASLDPDLVHQAEQGRLEREHFYTGLDGLTPAPPETRGGKAETATRQTRKPETAKAQIAKAEASESRRKPRADKAAGERRERESDRKRRAAQLEAARVRLAEAKKATAAAAKTRNAAARASDAAAKAAKAADTAYHRAEQRHSKALDKQARAEADLAALENAGN